MKSIICFRNYKTDEQTLANLKHLSSVGSDVVHLFDCTDRDKFKGAFNICYNDYVKSKYPLATIGQITKTRGNKKISDNLVYCEKWFQQSQMWYNTTHAIMLYWQEYPDYDYYWSLDSDVWFNGNWQDFFSLYESDNTDFLGTVLRDLTDVGKGQPYVGNFDFNVPYKRRMASYGCCQRYSNSLMQWIDREYKLGFFTFFEQMFPSVAVEFGGTAKDLNSDGRFTYSKQTIYCAKVSQYYMHQVNKNQNKLFHRMI
jgi:hypothetical protein